MEVSHHSQWCKEPICPVASPSPHSPRRCFCCQGHSLVCLYGAFLCVFECAYICVHTIYVMCSQCRCLSMPLCIHLTLNSVQSLTLPSSQAAQLMMAVIYWEYIQQPTWFLNPQRKKWIFVVSKMTKWPQSTAHKRTVPIVADTHFKEDSQSCCSTGLACFHLCD